MIYVLEASPMFPPCYITGGFSTNQQNASVGNMYPLVARGVGFVYCFQVVKLHCWGEFVKTLGLCPKPHSHLRGRRGMWQNLSTFPWAEC